MRLQKFLKGCMNLMFYITVILYWVFIGWWVGIIKILKNKKENNLKQQKSALGKNYNKNIKLTEEKNFDNNTNFLQANQELTTVHRKYRVKSLMTKYEQYFYNIINEAFADKYLIIPQVNLATILNKEKQHPNEYQNELFRNIDFGIFDKETTAPLLLIEINDKSHNEKKRQYRDIKVKEILNNANIKLITFHTEYPNEEAYVINRIAESLNDKKSA